jgi:hypothetical protein
MFEGSTYITKVPADHGQWHILNQRGKLETGCKQTAHAAAAQCIQDQYHIT